uniref:Uncharacterized protein n=1 Tax=uncultured marine group II/III euryarchaeote KM3_149_F06 TaxID=1457885 RepID=A0A075GBR4_9EURY|nr:hypothetical protein [uncultured marine group II/III euryarchaeote KM3_149_F06]
MKLEVNIDKKFAFMIIGSILILAGAIYVYAQNPAVFGHDWLEIDNRPAGLDNGDDDTNTNAKTECGNNKFLDGDGQCRTASQIVNDGGGGGSVQACRTCFRAAGSGSWGSWRCTGYAYPGGGQETSPVISGGDTGSGWTFQIRMQCI